MSQIYDTLWYGLKKLEPTSQLGGILARKPGYHNSRDHLPSGDYSIREFAVDRQGPAWEASAIDWTFPEAHSGNYRRIAKYSKRLYDAGKSNDPRTIYMREFFGNADSDSYVEGWDFSKDRASTSDKSHLWHIHISIHRKYVNDAKAMDAILSILRGESLLAWKIRTQFDKLKDIIVAPKPPTLPVALPRTDSDALVKKMPTLVQGAKNQAHYVKRLQWLLRIFGEVVTVDGVYGPGTARAVGRFQKKSNRPVNPKVVNEDDWEALVRAGMKGLVPILKKGNAPAWATKRAQTLLRNFGYNVEVDGAFGSKTESVVKTLQRKLALPQTGVIGKTEWNVLVHGKRVL